MPMPRKDNALHKLHSTTVPHDRTPDKPSALVASGPRYPKDITPACKKVVSRKWSVCFSNAAHSRRRQIPDGDVRGHLGQTAPAGLAEAARRSENMVTTNK